MPELTGGDHAVRANMVSELKRLVRYAIFNIFYQHDLSSQNIKILTTQRTQVKLV
jgi:hypothetical protein